MKTDTERGRWGRFLRGERTKRGLSQEQVREKLRARGFAVGESSYAEWESGYKQPTREAQQQFRELWKAEPEAEPVTPPSNDLAGLISAIGDLVAEMKHARSAEDERWEALVQALGAFRGAGDNGGQVVQSGSGVPRRGQE